MADTNHGSRDEGGEDEVFDVAIVGYGPVGTALAILLAQRGRRVVVLERWPAPYPLPRAVHFDHEVGRILQACGLGPELEGISEPAEIYEWRNAAGETLLRFGRTGHGLSGWPESSMFNQPQLEALLDERARAWPDVEVRRGMEVVGLDDHGDLVTLAIRPTIDVPPTGGPADQGRAAPVVEELAVRARYVVGADGANSTVRRLIGTTVTDLGFFYDWLIVDVVLDHERVFDPINLQICDPARPTTAVSGGPGRRRWEFMRLPHETLEELNDEASAWALLEPWDVNPANATLERHAVYTFQARWAEQWRAGRVLLAGDAAHQMPPFAGQGMCSGLRDAANLAWKLDLVLGGGVADPDALLDTYGEERQPNACAVIDFSMALGRVICVPDEAEAKARDVAMAAAVVTGDVAEIPPLPGLTAGIIDVASPHAGSLFVQGRVASPAPVHRTGALAPAGPPTRFDDVVGAGWRLVVAGAEKPALAPASAAWFASIGGQIVTVGAAGELADADGTYASWFAKHEAVAALQRPDFYLYGTAGQPADVPGLVASLRAHLTDSDSDSEPEPERSPERGSDPRLTVLVEGAHHG